MPRMKPSMAYQGFHSHGGTPKSSILMGFSLKKRTPAIGGFPFMETPKWLVHKGKSIYKWMIWGTPFKRKSPHVDTKIWRHAKSLIDFVLVGL